LSLTGSVEEHYLLPSTLWSPTRKGNYLLVFTYASVIFGVNAETFLTQAIRE